VLLDDVDDELRGLLETYVARLELPTERLRVTTRRAEFERWLGRRIGSSAGGAYVFLARRDEHAILINLGRVDLSRPKALEIVVAEELVHMRDHLDGDRRRHAKHGYDRIAYRVAHLTGASLEEVRSCLRPVQRRPPRYLYACPACGVTVPRRRTGVWSCGRCAPRFDQRFVLRLVEDRGPARRQ
jgi:predicted SprT family Zn-dependent metalloprotease